MNAASVTLEPWPANPFTGILTSFRGYAAFTQAPEMPEELRGYQILADRNCPDKAAYLMRDGELVATYILEFE